MSDNRNKKKIASPFVRGGIDIPFVVILFVLLMFGLIMVYSASIPTSIDEHNDASYLFRHQLYITLAGLAVMFIVSQINMYYVRLLTIPAYVVSFFLLILVFFFEDPDFPGFHRWIKIGGFSFQPSEVMKFALILILSLFMERYHSRIVGKKNSDGFIANAIREKTTSNLYIPESLFPTVLCGALIVIPAFLVMLGNHNSGMILLMIVGAVMLFIGDFKKGWFIVAGIAIVGLFVGIFVLYKMNPDMIGAIDRKGRILAWLDKDYSPTDKRWQINNALYAIGSGGLFGVGLGNSTQKYYYVSEPQNDMIFSIVCEELGFIGAAIILCLFAALVVRGVKIGIKAKDRFSSFVAIGTVMQVGVQVVLNVAVATDLIPNTGIGLPFFSYGGSSMLVFLLEMGIVLAISKDSRMLKK